MNCRENEHFQRRVSPPKRFVATQLSGGVKSLYKRLRNKEKPTHQRHGKSHTKSFGYIPRVKNTVLLINNIVDILL